MTVTAVTLLFTWYKLLPLQLSRAHKPDQRSAHWSDCSPESTQKPRENFRKRYLFNVMHCDIFQPTLSLFLQR